MKEWVEGLLPLERDLFFALNGSESLFLDNAMWTISGRLIWIPLYLFILFLLFYRMPKREGFWPRYFLSWCSWRATRSPLRFSSRCLSGFVLRTIPTSRIL